MSRLRTILGFFPLLLIIVATTIIILIGRGYRIDFRKNDLKSTGLLVARSDPDGAQVFVNGELKTATNNTINIEPDWYTVRIVKEGFLPWEKLLRVQGEVVTNTNAFLFPANPSLSPLTATGITHPTVSTDGTKLAYIVPENDDNGLSEQKSGLWILAMVDQPLAFNRDPKYIAQTLFLPQDEIVKILWSPDSSEILVLSQTRAYLFNTDKKDSFSDVTSKLPIITQTWQKQEKTRRKNQLALLPKKITDIVTSTSEIIGFAPDETKFLYEATTSATIPQVITPALIGTNPTKEQRTISKDNFYVYDMKEDKNYFIASRNELAPIKQIFHATGRNDLFTNVEIQQFFDTFVPGEIVPISWFPTSRHLIVLLDEKIDIMEYDRTNWITVYSGPHEPGFVVPWPGSSRLVILTNLNTKASKLSNLYSVNLR